MAKRVSLAESMKQAGAKAATVKVTFVLEDTSHGPVLVEIKKSAP